MTVLVTLASPMDLTFEQHVFLSPASSGLGNLALSIDRYSVRIRITIR